MSLIECKRLLGGAFWKMIFYSILIILLFLLFLSFWFIYCNSKTYKQRIEIINEMIEKSFEYSDNWKDCYKKYDKVSYNKHLWYLVTFRDPMKLY